MIFSTKPVALIRSRGFTLVELLVVIAVLGILLAVGASMMSSSPAQARRAGIDMLEASIEQARTHALTKRTHAVLAVVNPGTGQGNDPRLQRIGLFEVIEWPEDEAALPSALNVRQVGRWRTFESGLMLIDGASESGLPNPLDAPSMRLSVETTGGSTRDIDARVLVFHPRGGLRMPVGSEPVTLRLAEAAVRDGTVVPITRNGNVAESTLQVGRVIARPYRNDG